LAFLGLFLAAASGWAEEATVGERSLAVFEVAFTHGVAAFQRGDDEEAAQLFEQALSQDPQDGTVRHWLGLTYLRLGRRAEAVTQLAASLAAERPPRAGRTRVRQDLDRARRAAGADAAITAPTAPDDGFDRGFENLPRWEGRIGLAGGFDSNPGLVAEALSSFGGPEVVSGSASSLDLRLEHHPFYGRRGWSLGIALAGQQSMYQELSDLDSSFAEATVSLAWGRDLRGFVTGPLGHTRVPFGSGRISALLQAGSAYAELGGEPFLRSSEAALSLKLRESARTATQIDLEARKRTFLEGENGAGVLLRSGEEAAVGLSQYFSLGRGDRYLRLGFVTGEERGERDAPFALDVDFDEASAELAVPLSSRWALFVLASRREARSVVIADNFRFDEATWRGTAALSWQVADRLYWTLQGSYAQRDSDAVLSLLDYERTTTSVGFQWYF
jgi:hypothetical protein